MSAALVESVREAVAAREAFDNLGLSGAPISTHDLNAADRACIDAESRLDLPAILAALTEAEALRAQVVAQRATLLRWADASDAARRANLLLGVRDDAADKEYREASDVLMRSARSAYTTDTAALRKMLGEAWAAGFGDGHEKAHAHRDAVVDRVLGGS